MNLMLFMIKYYNLMYQSNEIAAINIWKKVEALCDKMESYYMPKEFDSATIGLYCRDILSRTQLGDAVKRCRGYRNSNSEN